MKAQSWSRLGCMALFGFSLSGCSAVNDGICAVMTCSTDHIILEPVNSPPGRPSDEAVIDGLRKAREAEARAATGQSQR